MLREITETGGADKSKTMYKTCVEISSKLDPGAKQKTMVEQKLPNTHRDVFKQMTPESVPKIKGIFGVAPCGPPVKAQSFF